MIKFRYASQKLEGQRRNRKHKSNKSGHELITTELGVHYTASLLLHMFEIFPNKKVKELNS